MCNHSILRNSFSLLSIILFCYLISCNKSEISKKKQQDLSEARVNQQINDLIDKSNGSLNDDYKNAIIYGIEAHKLASSTDSPILILETELHLGRLYFYKGLYENATSVYNQMLRRSKDRKLPEWEAQALFQLGGIRLVMEDYDEAMKYLKDSRTKFQKHFGSAEKIPIKFRAGIHNNLGIVYTGLKQFQSARKEIERGIVLCEEHSYFEPIYIQLKHNLGDIYLKSGEYQLANIEYNSAMQELEQHPNILLKSMIKNSIGQAYLGQKNYDFALSNLKEAFQLANHAKGFSHIRHTALGLSNIYKQLNHADSAYIYLQISKQYQDSLTLDKAAQKLLTEELLLSFEDEKAKLKSHFSHYKLLAAFLIFVLFSAILIIYLKNRNNTDQIERMSENIQIKEALAIVNQKENVELKKKIEVNKKELTSISINLIQKDHLIEQLSSRLKNQKAQSTDLYSDEISSIIEQIQSFDKNTVLNDFEYYFGNVHVGFFEKLQNEYPNLSRTERRLSAFLKLQLSTKEIAAITGQSIRAIEISRTRLRKKLKISKETVNICDFFAEY